MEVFQGNYKLYYSVMWSAGLWPYNNSFLIKIYRSAIVLMVGGCVVNQLSLYKSWILAYLLGHYHLGIRNHQSYYCTHMLYTMRNTKMTLNEIVVLLSFCLTLCLYFLRYFSTLLTMSTIKYLIDNMKKDYTALKDPMEIGLLLKYSLVAKRILQMYCGLLCCGMIGFLVTLGISTFLQSDSQLRFLHLLGFYFNERSLQSDLTCWHIIMAVTFGLLTVTCTEGSITIFSTYVSGLLEVASYRMRNTINSVANSDALNVIDLRPIVEMHCDAIKHSKKYTNDLMITSLVMVVVVAVAFGINIYRLFLSVTLGREYDEVLITLFYVAAYVTYMCGNNYSGQLLLESSMNFYLETCNSLWYRIPPKMQKMVLLAMVRIQMSVEFNLAGLFVPCYGGLTMVIDCICAQGVPMMRTSFSYFTLLCSVQ